MLYLLFISMLVYQLPSWLIKYKGGTMSILYCIVALADILFYSQKNICVVIFDYS